MNLNALKDLLGHVNTGHPLFALGLFLAGSGLMIWRLSALERKGIEGTVLGTLIMPYCSGFSNLTFALVMGREGGSGTQVLENCLVNNMTNLTLLIGLPAILWRMEIVQRLQKNGRKTVPGDGERLHYLSLLFTLIALMFFTGTFWALARDGRLDIGDGMVLVGLFIFWQLLHIFDVLKFNVYRKRSLSWWMLAEIAFILAGGYGVYVGIDRLVGWIPRNGTGWLVFGNIGWLSGFLMVLPNALLAVYYAAVGRADIVYSSQAGDAHICIPMCIGLYALFSPMQVPQFFQIATIVLLAAALIHFFSVMILRRLPRIAAAGLVAVYGVFVYQGFLR